MTTLSSEEMSYDHLTQDKVEALCHDQTKAGGLVQLESTKANH